MWVEKCDIHKEIGEMAVIKHVLEACRQCYQPLSPSPISIMPCYAHTTQARC